MKNKAKNTISIISIIITMMLVILPATVFAGVESQMTVTVRIEGVSETFYYDTLQVPYSGATLSVKAALEYVDAQSEDVVISGMADGFVSDVNGDSSAMFGGWDGWSYMVNNITPDVGIDSYQLAEDDSVILFYGDPFGAVPMQFPEIDDTNISQGKLKIISKDSSYGPGPDYILTITENPVIGAKITWQYGDSVANYTTDANGEIIISADHLTMGAHAIQIEKYSTTAVDGKYIPLVLRFAPDMVVMVAESIETTPVPTTAPTPTTTVDDVISQTGSPATHDTVGSPIVITLALVTILLVVARKKGLI